MNRMHVFTILSVLVGSMSTTRAHAGDSDERRAIDASSRKAGVGRANVKAASRADDPKRGTALADTLLVMSLGAVTNGAEKRMPTADGGVRIEGAGWYLEVNASGSAGQYYNSAPANAIEVDQRLSDSELFARARALITGELGSVIEKDENQLYPLQVRHQLHASGTRDSMQPTLRQLVSSQVVFGRKLDGVPVVGPGSKFFVELSASGELLGYRFDWSRLSLGSEEQTVVDVQTIVERASSNSLAVASKPSDYTRFECGYYDQGASSGGAALQSACLAQNVSRGADGKIIQAVEEYVPAAVTVRADPNWPLARSIAGERPDPVPAPADPPKMM